MALWLPSSGEPEKIFPNQDFSRNPNSVANPSIVHSSPSMPIEEVRNASTENEWL